MLQQTLPQHQPSQQLLVPQACWMRCLYGLTRLLQKRRLQVSTSTCLRPIDFTRP
jgi:Sec7-like guanine-nucleotide exchange factor